MAHIDTKLRKKIIITLAIFCDTLCNFSKVTDVQIMNPIEQTSGVQMADCDKNGCIAWPVLPFAFLFQT